MDLQGIRVNRLRQCMAQEKVDLLTLGPGAHMQWLLGFHPFPDERPCLLCVSQNGIAFLMPALNAEGTRASTDLPFYEWTDAEGPKAAFHRLLADLDIPEMSRIALDETMRADFAALVQNMRPKAERQFTASTVGTLRMRKDEEEYRLLKENAAIADRVMETVWAKTSAGLRERDVMDIVRQSFTEHGAEPMFHIIGAGKNGAFPHHHTSDTVLKDGDAVVVDLGGGKDGYVSDITRMMFLGDPTPEYLKIHQIVDNAVSAALKAARPGVLAKDVDAAARKVIADAGYGDYFVHRLGHGLGSEVHEQPYLSASSNTVLEAGMVFSIEPGIYLPGKFGVRLEEIVILRPDGPEILSQLPRDLVIIS